MSCCCCYQVRAICTLHELDECLREFTQNRADFETLKLGPLVKLPLVYQFFKVPLDADVCEMTTADVIEYLRGYLSANNLWTTKIELENFLQYIMDTRGLSSPYELGLRISSPALAIQVTDLYHLLSLSVHMHGRPLSKATPMIVGRPYMSRKALYVLLCPFLFLTPMLYLPDDRETPRQKYTRGLIVGRSCKIHSDI